MATDSSIIKFDPAIHQDNVYDAFCEFLDSFGYEYEAIAKDPPAGDANEQLQWIELNKR